MPVFVVFYNMQHGTFFGNLVFPVSLLKGWVNWQQEHLASGAKRDFCLAGSDVPGHSLSGFLGFVAFNSFESWA